MTKAEYRQRAIYLSHQVGRCYSMTVKRKIVSDLLEALRKSLEVN